jgi:hypothetical protein
MKPIYLIPLISLLALAGCAHKQPQPPKTQESFSTQIKPDGTKQFSYTLVMEMPERDAGGRPHGGPNGHGGHEGHGGKHGDHGTGPQGDHKDRSGNPKDDSMQEELGRLFDDGLNSKLNSTGFCRTGFMPLDTQNRRGAQLVKGECNEMASDADRIKFPNPPPKKIKVDVLE